MPKGIYIRTKKHLKLLEKARRFVIYKPHSEETKKKISNSIKEYNTIEIRKKKSEEHKGNKNYYWIDGRTSENHKIRNSLEMKMWRESVFERDNYTCQHCGQRGCILNADHIKPFSVYPKLRFKIDNGRTLCIDCHRKTDTWGNKILYHKLKQPPHTVV